MRKTLGNGFARALFAVKRRKAVVNARSVLRVFISASFIGADVDEHRLIHIARHRQNRCQGAQVVSVERAVIIKAKILKDRGVENILFDLVFYAAHFGSHVLAHLRHAAQCGFDTVFCVQIPRLCAHIGKITRNGAYVAGNGHGVVIQNDDHIAVDAARIVEALIRKAAGQRAVADDGDDMAGITRKCLCNGKAERRRNGRAAVPRCKRVAVAFFSRRKARKPILAAQRGKRFFSAG